MLYTLRWRIAIPYIALIVLAMLGLLLYLTGFVRQARLADLRAQLTDDARLVGDALTSQPGWVEPTATFDDTARHYADLLGARVTIIATDGTVVGESHEDRAQMDNHLFRPEVQQALAEGMGSSVRFSETLDQQMMYVAVTATAGGATRVVRVALPAQQVEASVAHLRGAIVLAGLLTTVGAALLAVFLAWRAVRPVRQLTEVVQRMAGGDLGARLLPTTRDEVGALARSFNQMADRLRGTITTLSEERSRLAAVLENMADGVLITDEDGRVRLINPSAGRLLGTDTEAALGRTLAEVARDYRIISLWQRCREQGTEQVEPVEMGRQGPFFQIVVTPLQGGPSSACLVILQDLTRVRRLETVRRDFISNVSHELRTPLASLKALVETLRGGALEDATAAPRFLDRMETEVDAMTQIVQELLELSRIESGRAPLQMAAVPAEEIILPSVERLRPQAERAGLQLTVELPPDLPPVLADAERIRQAITNVLHNAIKFTPAGGRIAVRASLAEGDMGTRGQGDRGIRRQGEKEIATLPLTPCLLVSISDTGVGIAEDDLPRIFERFYKADRARSGGGTGLGLSIARHIVEAHGGRIWAESVEGRGSTFYLTIPIHTPHPPAG